MLEDLKKQVCEANLELPKQGLVIFSWGNVSGFDRDKGIVAIKPSGVDYNTLTPDTIVLIDLEGKVVEGELKPSSDTPTHLELYKAFDTVNGICHTHSMYATIWAQANRPILCLGTTHADYFYGSVPVTETMEKAEIEEDYEANTGRLIVRRFKEIDSKDVPAVLVAGHGPFTWGSSPQQAVESSIVLETVAKMALNATLLSPSVQSIDQVLLDKHFLRKHGSDAYYGQTPQ